MATEYLGVKQVAERLGITSGGLLNLKLPEPDAMIGRTRGWLPESALAASRCAKLIRRGSSYALQASRYSLMSSSFSRCSAVCHSVNCGVGISGVLEVVVSAFESFAQDLAVVDSGLFAERVEPCGDSDVLAH